MSCVIFLLVIFIPSFFQIQRNKKVSVSFGYINTLGLDSLQEIKVE